MFTLLSSFCIWTKNLTYISQLTSNNIISCCKSDSELCPLKTPTAETRWELYIVFTSVFPIIHCVTYAYIYIYIYIYICISDEKSLLQFQNFKLFTESLWEKKQI